MARLSAVPVRRSRIRNDRAWSPTRWSSSRPTLRDESAW